MDKEKRYFDFDIKNLTIEKRDDGEPVLQGYAVLWNQLSTDLGGFKEKIAKGAFAKSLKSDRDVKILWNHNTDKVLGSTKAGTLLIEERTKGLYFENTLPATQFARDLAISIGRCDISGVSFGFMVREDKWSDQDKKEVIRTVLDGDLFEISPCTFPAYEASSVSVRAFENFKKLNINTDVLDSVILKLNNLKQKADALH